MLQYYGKFLPDLSKVLEPLNKFLCKKKNGYGKKNKKHVFRHSKDLLKCGSVLVHYNPNEDLVISCDASAYGVGAVLSHCLSDGSEHPIE